MKITTDQLASMEARIAGAKTGYDVIVGVDPGVHTGLAVWARNNGLTRVESMMAVEAEVAIKTLHDLGLRMMVYVEDTRKLRLPKALQNAGRAKGAGSVHRDMSRFSEFLTYHSIPHQMVGIAPKEYRTSTDEWFRKKTGWSKRTNEHARCAAGLILSRL